MFNIGDKVRLRNEVDRSHEFIAPAGLTGVVKELTNLNLFVKMDEPLPGAEEWDNCIVWGIGTAEEKQWVADDLELR